MGNIVQFEVKTNMGQVQKKPGPALPSPQIFS